MRTWIASAKLDHDDTLLFARVLLLQALDESDAIEEMRK